jgi:hypothetical protein
MKTVIALFQSFEDANRAIDALREANVPRDAISVLVRQEVLPGVMGPDAGPIDRSRPPLDAPNVAESVGAGAVSGGLAVAVVRSALIRLTMAQTPRRAPATIMAVLSQTRRRWVCGVLAIR